MDQRWTSTSMTGQIAYDGDIPMEDADLDPYNKQKYEDVGRGHSAGQDAYSTNRSRPTSQYIKDEESSAARRYSPMKLSSTSQDAAPSQYTSYSPNSQSSRQSPSRPTLLTSNSYSYYQSPSPLELCLNMDQALTYAVTGSRAQASQLSSLQGPSSPESNYYSPRSAVQQQNLNYGRDYLSPIGSQLQQSPLPPAQVPKFTRCTDIAELQPNIRSQPPFRRANPEGGFISVRECTVIFWKTLTTLK